MYALQKRSGFSLIELVIVIVIIGIIGAIAIPRMSRGAAGAADSALTANLAVLRNAIDLYQTEHGGTYPSFASFEAQLTTFTDEGGTANADRTAVFIYGPYLRGIPPLPVGASKGSAAIVAIADGTGGWVYNETTGRINANTPDTETDVRNKPYNQY